MRAALAALLLLAAASAEARVGRPAPGWGGLPWAVGGPLRWEDLRGKVVLVRWWTGPRCHYCASTAPALRELHARYAARGLKVVGMFHPKPRPRPVPVEEAARHAAEKGFTFPVAVDADWAVLRRWWDVQGWTSITILVDKRGVVRHVHPGGEFHAEGGPHTKPKPLERCVAEHAEMRAKIEALLAEPTP